MRARRDSALLACSLMGLVMSVICATIWGPYKLCKWLWLALLEQGVSLDDPRRSLPISFSLWFYGEHHKCCVAAVP